MTHQKRNKIIAIVLPFSSILLLFFKRELLAFTQYLPSCFVYSKLHLYCPACGNTRSVAALLEGNILASLQYNVTPGLVLLLALLAYIEFVAASFNRPLKLLPRKLWFYLVLIALLVLYYIVRNLSPFLAP